MAGVVCARPLAGRNALGRRGGGVLRRILQPFHHLALDGGADRLGGGGPQAVRRLAQHVLASRVPGGGGAQLGRLNHVGGGVGQGFRRRQQAFLNGGRGTLVWQPDSQVDEYGMCECPCSEQSIIDNYPQKESLDAKNILCSFLMCTAH